MKIIYYIIGLILSMLLMFKCPMFWKIYDGASDKTEAPFVVEETTAQDETAVEETTVAVSETTAAPESSAVPESCAVSETTEVPETGAVPETNAAPETTPASYSVTRLIVDNTAELELIWVPGYTVSADELSVRAVMVNDNDPADILVETDAPVSILNGPVTITSGGNVIELEYKGYQTTWTYTPVILSEAQYAREFGSMHLPELEEELLRQMNDVRVELGLDADVFSERCQEMARNRAVAIAQEYLETGDCSHNNSGDYIYITDGGTSENILHQYPLTGYVLDGKTATASVMAETFRASEGHFIRWTEDVRGYFENRYVGVGIYYEETSGYLFVSIVYMVLYSERL